MFLPFEWMLGALVVAISASGANPPVKVPPNEARRCAERDVAASPAMLVERFREAYEGASSAEPLLVERLDREGSAYYLVPFRRGSATSLVAMVDAGDCRLLEATYLQVPGIYLPVSEEEARARVLASPLASTDRHEVETQRPTLVWQVCQWSQSPYEPLWRLRMGQGVRYVDQTGAVHDRMEAPKLKGGGGPVGPPGQG